MTAAPEPMAEMEVKLLALYSNAVAAAEIAAATGDAASSIAPTANDKRATKADDAFRVALKAALSSAGAVESERELLQACGVIEEIVGSKQMQRHPDNFDIHAYTVKDGEYNDYRMLRKHHLVRIANAAAAIRARKPVTGAKG